MYRERVNEKLPTEYLLHEFDELISCKSLGSYNCCEMVFDISMPKRKGNAG